MLRSGDRYERVDARTIIWAAGVRASPLAAKLAVAAGLDLDRQGRIPVTADLTLRGAPDVYVIGHTDTVGEYRTNDRLSAVRAETVKGFLIGIGIPAERIQTAGRGEREPIVPTADESDEPLNRRVEINVR